MLSHKPRVKRNFTCQHCGEVFQAARSDALFCRHCKEVKGIHRGLNNTCPICGEYKYGGSKRCHKCENKLRAKARREKNKNWRGGTTNCSGYTYIRVGAGAEAKYVPEHHLVWEKSNGRIPEGYVIHHLNGIKGDNRIENLQALPRAAHAGSAVLNKFKQRIRQLETENKLLKERVKEYADAATPA